MAFPSLRRKEINQSAGADRYATEVLRKVDRGSSNVPGMNFVIEKIRAKEPAEASY